MFQRFELENWQSDYEHTVAYNLADSTIEPVRLRELLPEGKGLDELLDVALYYPQVNGERALRDAIAARYPEGTVGAADVLVTVGASEANAVVVDALCAPGDRVVLMQPGYQQVWGLARNKGCDVRGFALRPEHGWRPDLDALEREVDDGTTMIYICNPNNPTGYVLTEDEVDRIVDIAAAAGAWILADEVYQGSERHPGKRALTFVGRHDRVVAVNSMSKTYGLSGLRIGWAIAEPGLLQRLWRRHEYAAIATGRVDNVLARLALTEPLRSTIIDRNRAAVEAGWTLLRRWADHNANVVSVTEPEATGLAFVSYDLGLPSIELGHALRERASVLVCPGTFFGLDRHLRVNFGFGAEYVRRALDAMTPILQELARRPRASCRRTTAATD